MLSINQEASLAFDCLSQLRRRPIRHFHIPACVLLEGPLDLRALERAVNAVIARHTTLRTEFTDIARLSREDWQALMARLVRPDGWNESLFTATVRPAASLALQVRSVPAGVLITEEARDELMLDEAVRPFLYTRSPLVRVAVFDDGAARHLLTVVFHHLVADGMSTQIFLHEVWSYYRAAVDKRSEPPLEELPLDYTDYARRQRQQLSGESARLRLADCQQRYRAWAPHGVTFADCPMLRREGADAHNRAAIVGVPVDRDIADRLTAFGRTFGCTLYVSCLAALFALCHLHARRDKIALWGALANRAADTEGLIGWLSEGRVIGVEVAAGTSFRALAAQVRQALLDMTADRELPMAAIHYGSHRRPHRSIDGDDAVHITLQSPYRRFSERVAVSDELSMLRLRIPYNQTRVENVVKVSLDVGDDMTLWCTYSRQRISDTGMATWLRQLRQVIADGVREPDRPITQSRSAHAAIHA